MEMIRTLSRRRTSCRNFTDEVLPKEKLTELINNSVWVPSGSNNQPWRFVVITDKAKIKAYSDAAKKMWLENLPTSPHMQQYEKTFRDPTANIFYNASSIIIIYGNTESYWYIYDCSMVAGNLHLLAEEEELGCCWIGEAHNIFADPIVKKELGVPENYALVAPLIIGHPAGKKSVTESSNKRKPFKIIFA
ncbi:Coenzyme F420:L-glutamate ligase [Sporomusa ovata DSM 2662]|uniref:Nitroreductase n=1 Tax=Sporomusa ovata TaxID=2378 RepID=A0A0U1KVP9_9FIRM|nr:nitroreductase family protein [Sporomusa ovata]EQB26881.1 nitroreductase [Sporomusa ovata DSM 2662]CQR70983.1 nitroreductase [Sporomusa ovata]